MSLRRLCLMRWFLFVAGVIAGCGTSPREAPTADRENRNTGPDAAVTAVRPPKALAIRTMMNMTSKEVVAKSGRLGLRTTVHVEDRYVKVVYTMANGGSTDVYVTDFSVDAVTGKPLAESLRVEYEPPITLVLTRRLEPLPKNANWAHPPTAYVNKVPAGGTHRATLQVARPLRVEGATQAAPTAACQRIRFEVGVIPESADLQAKHIQYLGHSWYELSTAAWGHAVVMSAEFDGVPTDVISK